MERPILPGYYLRFSIFRWIGWHIGQATGSAARGVEDGYRDAAGTVSGMLTRAFVALVLILLAVIFVAFLSPAHAALCLVSLGILVILFQIRMPGSVRALLYFLVGAQVVWGLLSAAYRFAGDSSSSAGGCGPRWSAGRLCRWADCRDTVSTYATEMTILIGER